MSGRNVRRHRPGHDGAQPRAQHRVARLPGRGLEPRDRSGSTTSSATTQATRSPARRRFEELAAALERPRRIMMMIPGRQAGRRRRSRSSGRCSKRGDVLIDGGNSWFEDTRRREAALRPAGIHFVGCGVSGGEEGARFGPSLMPGGSADAWARIKDVLEAIAAKTDAGPCVTHVGPDGAGHFVKMVHNGIEYGDMQLIAEAYDVLRRGLGLSAPETADVFDEWNRGPLESFLVELTAQVCRVDRTRRPGSRSSTSCSTRPARRGPASGRRRSRSTSASRSRRSPRRSTRACCRA